MAIKKSSPKKASPKKAIQKKAALKKAAPVKAKTKPEKETQKEIIPASTIEETPAPGDCMCRQKRPNGKFFSFSLVQGRWVQSSAVPFPTKELCEEANC
ncbi:MAG: hypothetical protein ABI863_02910 [Ginsengibacter sp.]